MKTKEELEDEKLFADFIEYPIKVLKYIDKDTKQEVICEYFNELGNTFNPKEDWNLLMKGYSKLCLISSVNHPKQGLKLALLDINNKLVYKGILEFIKESIKYTNTNKNQS